jgi:hypothetical protein
MEVLKTVLGNIGNLVGILVGVGGFVVLLVRFFGERRPAKKVLYTTQCNQIDLPLGASYNGRSLNTVATLKVSLFNVGREPIEKLDLGILLSNRAALELRRKYQGPRVEGPTSKVWDLERTDYGFVVDQINDDSAFEFELLCMNAGCKDPEVKIASCARPEYLPPDAFYGLKKRKYALSKMVTGRG